MLRSRAHTAYLLLSLTALFWAGNAIVARALHASIPPIGFAFWRWVVASAMVLPFAWPRLRTDWRALARHWPLVLLLSVLGISVFNTLLYHAAHTTTATNIALIQTAMPAAIVLIGSLLFQERVSFRGALGVALSMLGTVVIVLRGNPITLADWYLVPGDAWMLLAVLGYALYSVLLRKRPAVHPLSFLAATFVVGALVLLPPYLAEAVTVGGPTPSCEVVAGILYVAALPSVAAYLFWNWGVDLIGASRAGFFVCLIPVFTSGLAVLFLGERLHLFHLMGLMLIVGGFVLFHRNEAPRVD